MPFLDVTDVLFDPDFCELLTVVRSASVTGNDGIDVVTKSTATFTAVVTSDKGQDLNRDSVGEHAGGTIMVITKFKLTSSGPGLSADVVQWNGASYTVKKINDYSKYGRGVIEATCELVPLTGYTP